MVAHTVGMGVGWGTGTVVETLPIVLVYLFQPGDVETVRTTTLPADAVVTSASAAITVREASSISVGRVAQVRQGQSGQVVVLDFGALRTVASLTLPAGKTLQDVRKWAGDGFTYMADGIPAGGTTGSVSFAEVQTERLELTFSTSVDAALLAEQTIEMPGLPTDLRLEVNGTTVWSKPGPARLAEPTGGGTAEARFNVPLAAELQAALAHGPDPVVTLRSATPCGMGLELSIAFVRAHAVALPPSGLVLGADAEAEMDAPLPLPADAGSWQVRQVDVTLSGRLPSWRAWPVPDGPENIDARLVLDPGHSYAARLPAGWLAPLAEVTGVRLPLLLPAGFGGAEIAAVLYQGDLEQPAQAVPGARFKPADVPADPAGGLRWVEIAFAKPVKTKPAATWWVELACTRGSCDWPMTQALDDTGPDSVRLRRSLPGPPFRPLAVRARRGTAAVVPCGRLHLLGTPRSDDLRPAVVPLLAGSGAPQVATGVTPSASTGTVTLTPTIAATAARGEIAGGALRLRLRLHTAGQVTINAATVYYQKP